MTSLRELIEGKARRTRKLPILVGDATAAAERVQLASVALEQARLAGADEAEVQQLREELDAAVEEQTSTVVLVELQSLAPDEWDAIFGPIEPDADGEIDLDECRAVLLAASCTDPGLQDADWWQQQLARPEWTKGEKLGADDVLLGLNLRVPMGPPGKG